MCCGCRVTAKGVFVCCGCRVTAKGVFVFCGCRVQWMTWRSADTPHSMRNGWTPLPPSAERCVCLPFVCLSVHVSVTVSVSLSV